MFDVGSVVTFVQFWGSGYGVCTIDKASVLMLLLGFLLLLFLC